jgi:hypothetical protein
MAMPTVRPRFLSAPLLGKEKGSSAPSHHPAEDTSNIASYHQTAIFFRIGSIRHTRFNIPRSVDKMICLIISTRWKSNRAMEYSSPAGCLLRAATG